MEQNNYYDVGEREERDDEEDKDKDGSIFIKVVSACRTTESMSSKV